MKLDQKKFTDFFSLLDVDKQAKKEDIQKAFMLKASVWHPDKAETEEDKEHFTKVYQDLQTAYKVLSNEHSRKQYIDSQQTTDIEFKQMDRDTGYHSTDQFKKEDGKFDEDAFNMAFRQGRDKDDQAVFEKLDKQAPAPEVKVTHDDYASMLAKREEELKELAQAPVQQILAGDNGQ